VRSIIFSLPNFTLTIYIPLGKSPSGTVYTPGAKGVCSTPLPAKSYTLTTALFIACKFMPLYICVTELPEAICGNHIGVRISLELEDDGGSLLDDGGGSLLDDGSDSLLDDGSDSLLDDGNELLLDGGNELLLDGGSELLLDDGSELLLDNDNELLLDDCSELLLGSTSAPILNVMLLTEVLIALIFVIIISDNVPS